MAILEKLQGLFKLREAWPRIERNDEAINAEIVGHKASDRAHNADTITYSGDVAGANNVKQAIDGIKGEINTIVAHAGDGTKDTELIIARGDEPTLGDRLNTSDDRLDNKIIVTDNPPAVVNRLEGSFYFRVTDSIPVPTDNENLRVSPSMGIKILE